MYIDSHIKDPLLLSDFNETLNLSIDFREIVEYEFSMKILPTGAELFQAERQRDVTTLKVSLTILPTCLKNTRGMSVGAMPYLSKVCLPYNLKIRGLKL